jgi:hypothetical protein
MGRPACTQFTAAKRQAFLAALVAAGGHLAHACTAVGVHRVTVFKLRQTDPAFAAAYAQALDEATAVLEDEAIRRAVEGIDKPMYYKGELVATVKEYSDQLLMFLLRARKPLVYREHKAVELELGRETRTVLVHRYGAPEPAQQEGE